ncbi:MAG TPA: hypothetical protein VF142_23170 [Longimicrobium sp.]
MPLRHARTLCLVLFAALAACEGTTAPPTDLPAGTMQLEVSGDTSFTVSGVALYHSPQMALTDQAGQQDPDFMQLFLEVPANPQARRYEGMTTGTVLFIIRGGVIVRQFGSTSGWVDLYEVATGNVRGYAQVTLQEVDDSGQPIPGNTITVRPVFNATRQ